MIKRWQTFMSRGPDWGLAVVLVLCLNLLFVALLFAGQAIPRETIAQRIREAFAANELGQVDYLPYDSTMGFHQYNDCVILQMMSNPDPSITGRALGPLVYSKPSEDAAACQTLRELVVEGQSHDGFDGSRYTRYWHGYIPVLSTLLTFLSVAQTRYLLRAMVYVSVLLLIAATVREKRIFPLSVSVGLFGLLFWGLPYFGLGMSHALGDATVMLGLGSLIFWHRSLLNPHRLIPFCSLFGSVIMFFEMLTGPLPVASGLLFPTVYLLSRLTNPTQDKSLAHGRLALKALLAFAFGAVFTLAFRVVIALTMVQPSGVDLFLANLQLYTQSSDFSIYGESMIPTFLRPLGRLFLRGQVFTYGSNWGMYGLYLSAGLAWTASAVLATRARDHAARADWIAHVIGAVSIPLWTFILQTHTMMHVGFMTRILIVPIALGWAALIWQWRLSRHKVALQLT